VVADTANSAVIVARVSKPKTLVALVSFDFSLCRGGHRADRAVLLAGLLSHSLFLSASLSLS